MKTGAVEDNKPTCKSTVKVSSARPFKSIRECGPPRPVEIPTEEPIRKAKGCQRSNQCQDSGEESLCGSPSNLPFPRLDGKLPQPSDKCNKGFLDECKCFCETVMNVFAPPVNPKHSPTEYYTTGKVVQEKKAEVQTGKVVSCKQSVCRPNVENKIHYLEPAPVQIAKPLKPERYIGRPCKKDTQILRGRITKEPVRRNYLENLKTQKKPLGRTFPNDYEKAFETKYQCKRVPAFGDKCGTKHKKKKGSGYLRPLEKKPADTRNAVCGCARPIACKKKRN
ncbi:PREDICTED: uncharacterized protein LOC108563175 [Nicrophorus vespilloides]|uniref:Uncharacterized protein LOC108563175 n=1 Tax=Nicrophorus vespilloides TaxID=110193 RepID=A0ABM1MRR9_NICVS|nr:PREDICTED: uncharacterized protein LOC108563175 [Nicrophorus vespilloides]